MDGWQAAVQPHGLAQLRQGQVRLLPQQNPHLLLMGGRDARLGTGKTVAWRNVPRASTLLQELLDQAEGNPETPGDFLAVALFLIVNSQDAFPHIQGNRSHENILLPLGNYGYSFI
jgi:hypothetical protein